LSMWNRMIYTLYHNKYASKHLFDLSYKKLKENYELCSILKR